MSNAKVTIETVKGHIRNIPDFPKEGINFKDITTSLKHPEDFKFIVDTLYEKYKDCGITKVIGVESRGFIFGGALAEKLNAGFVPVRKPGKLPADTFKASYNLEYGSDSLEIHKDALCKDDVVLIHDDVLATGGTIMAAINLTRKFELKDTYVNFICELSFLDGRKNIDLEQDKIYSLIEF